MSDTPSQAPPSPGAPAPSPAPAGRGWTLVAPLLLLAASVALFLPTVNFRLVYDDHFLIANNATMAPVADSFAAAFDFFGQEYWEGVNPNQVEALRTRGQALYRPLTLFLWGCVVAAQGGWDPTWGLHLLNIAGNALVVLLLYRLAWRLSGSARTGFAAALLFAMHPLHSEAVAYVAGLSDVLSAAAVLGGLLLWERATRDPGRLHMGAFAGLMAVFFLGLLAKEGAAVLAAAVALTDVLLALRGERRGGFPRVAVYGGLLLLLALAVLVRWLAVGYLVPSDTAISNLDNPLIREPFGIRLINGVKLLAFQLWLFLWPQQLSIDYSFNAIPTSRSWTQAEPLAAGVLVLALLAWGLVMLRRRPAAGWGVLLFLGAATFTSNILLPIGTLFGERLAYLPSAGLCLALAVLADGLLRDRRPGASPHALSAVGLVVLLVAAGLLGARTVERNRDFETSERLFESALEVVPQSARIHYQLGALLGTQGLFTKAQEHYERALDIDPTFIQAALGRGDVLTAGKNWEKAIETYDRILKNLGSATSASQSTLDEVMRMVYMKRAAARMGKGDQEGSVADLRQAMQIESGEDVRLDPFLLLARMQVNRGKPEEAIPVLRQALALKPDSFAAQYELAKAGWMARDDEAFEQGRQALERDERGRPWALAMRGEQLYEEAAQSGDETKRQEALSLLEEVREALPDLPLPYVYRGRFLAEKGRFLDAILEFDRALERTPRLPSALRFKAMAQNMSGRPKEALETLAELELVSPDASCYAMMFRSHFMLGNLAEMEAAAAKAREKGTPPETVVLDLSIALRNAGRVDDAIAAIESGRLLPGMSEHPDLLFNLSVLLLDAGRFEEALATIDRLEAAQLAAPGGAPDPFLPVNRARCLMGLGRDVEAAAQLELFEKDVVPESKAWLSLAHRRSELFLRRGSPFFDPAQAAELSGRGLVVAQMAHPGLLDVSLEALAATRDFAAARARADEAVKAFPGLVRYQVAARAMQLAADGDLAGAVAALRKGSEPALERIAAQVEAGA